jgi:hypothetical protein
MHRIQTAILFLVSGLLVYWFFNPEIYFFEIFGLHNNNHIIIPSNNLFLFLKNYAADILFCAAAFTTALYFADRHYPAGYTCSLVALPFLSEILQGLRIMHGTFDWVDLLIYSLLLTIFYKRNITSMKRISGHLGGIAAVLIFALAVVGSSGSKRASKPLPPPPPKVYTNGTVKLTEKPDEVFSKPALSQFLKSVKNLSLVLRVPGQVTKVLEEQKYSSNSIYNTIEKEFAKSGYTVRDRGLFQQVLENKGVDYSKIKELTETDLIVEIVGYQKVLYPLISYTDSAGNEIRLKTGFTITGIKAEFKIISVKDNDFVGSYVFYSTPCVNGCKYIFDEYGIYKGSDTDYFDTTEKLENFFKECSIRLQAELKAK